MKLAALALALVLIGCATATAEPRGGAPVVIELYTSQGCSSCPPADRVLAQIAKDGKLAGRAVVPLAFHVDYWNDLGWADPFSRGEWSARQARYAKDRGPYTPQAVIAGTADALGSDRRAIERAVAAAPVMAAIDAHATRARGRVHVTATAPAGADVWVAIWDDGLATDVPRGENAGAHLTDDRIVRALARVAAAGTRGEVDVPLEASWKASGAVAFAQREDLAIVGATVLTP